MTDLTPRQAEIFSYLRTCRNQGRNMPTVRELQALTGIKSPNGITGHLHALERKGLIVREPYTSRGINIVGDARLGCCPHCGKPLTPERT